MLTAAAVAVFSTFSHRPVNFPELRGTYCNGGNTGMADWATARTCSCISPGRSLELPVHANNTPGLDMIHQIWIGDDPPPLHWIDTWRCDYAFRRPGVEYYLWTENLIEQLDPPLVNTKLYHLQKQIVGKVDVARLEIVFRYGGVYIDADSSWIQPTNIRLSAIETYMQSGASINLTQVSSAVSLLWEARA